MMRFRVPGHRRVGLYLGVGLLTLFAVAAVAGAQGGTAKPPKGGAPASPVPVPPPPPLAQPVFSADIANIHQFDVTGFIQDATVDGSICPAVADAHNFGGTVKVNGLTITIPCNSVVQMPASSWTWADLFSPTDSFSGAPRPPVTLAAAGSGSGPFPSFEISVSGNIVGDRYIAALVYGSQQSLMSGQGVIRSFDYSDAAHPTMIVGPSTGAAAGDMVRIQLNDPNGRFGTAQSPDERFAVDDKNPTIHGGTGYPMCVPRTDPAVADDPLCPQRNRPQVASPVGCRNFASAGVLPLPASGELPLPAAGQTYCGHFVMKAPTAAVVADPTEPNAMEQAPFEVGDTIFYGGTLEHSATPGADDYISAHTVEANVGIYTQPNTLPAYTAIGGFGVGLGAAGPTNLVAQEIADRMFLEAEVTDIKSVVDIYMVDVDAAGHETNRWISPQSMTGEANGPSFNGALIGGGMTTQFAGPQPQRARLRAVKAPAGLLSEPTRNLRVMVRSLCTPVNVNANTAPAFDPAGAAVPCVDRAPAANGISSGMYTAPVFEFIGPENTSIGDPIVPTNFWSLGFLTNGDPAGPASAPGIGGLDPKPW